MSSFPQAVKLSDNSLNVAYLLQWINVIFHIIPEYTDSLVPSLHHFKNSFPVETQTLHSQPFTKSHFHFSIITGLAMSKAKFFKLVPKWVKFISVFGDCVKRCDNLIESISKV
jgi:hypothetical protein